MAYHDESEKTELLIKEDLVKYHSDNGGEKQYNWREPRARQGSKQPSQQSLEPQQQQRLEQLEQQVRQLQEALEQRPQQINREPGEQKQVSRKCQLCGINCVWVLIILATTTVALASLALGTYNQVKLMQPTSAITYDRIGHRECTKGATKIYSGVTVGFPTQTGSTTFQCMPNMTKYVEYHKPFTYGNTSVYYVNTTKYETFKENSTGKDVACAKCSVEGRDTIELMPSTHKCQPPWSQEYIGYLMTDRGSTVFVCVDANMKPVEGEPIQNSEGPTLYHVVAYFPSHWHYEGYHEDRALSCAVCSK